MLDQAPEHPAETPSADHAAPGATLPGLARRPAHPAAWAVLLTIVLAAAFWRPMWDIDLFWHLEAGRWMLQHLALPDTDIFSYTDPGRPWYSFQWAYELLLALLEPLGGLQALHLLHVAVIAVAFGGLFFQVASRAGLLAGLLVTGVLLLGFGDRVRERPDAFNLLFTVALLPWLSRPGFLGWGRVLALGLLALTWASVHAGGVLLLGLLLGGRWGARLLLPEPGATRSTALRQGLAEALCLLGLPLAPGFLGGLGQAFSMLDASVAFIPEWMPTHRFLLDHARGAFQVTSALGLLLWPLLTLALFLLGSCRPRPWRDLWLPALLALPLCYLAARHVRFLWLPALLPALGYLARPHLQSPGPHEASSCPPAGALRARLLLGLALGLLAFGLHHQVFTLSGGPSRALAQAGTVLQVGAFPETAARALRGCGATGRVFNHAPWGGHLLYALGPGTTVFSDGRGNFDQREARTLAALDRVSTRRPALEEAHHRAPFDLLVHPAPFPRYDQDPERFTPVLLDPVAEVFVALDRPDGPQLAARLRACLAGPGVLPAEAVLCDPRSPPVITPDLSPGAALTSLRCLAALGRRQQALVALEDLLGALEALGPAAALPPRQELRARVLFEALRKDFY